MLAYAGGKMRQRRIRIIAGDRVSLEMSPYDATRGRISYRSPIGAALLRKSVDDEVVVDTPKGRRRLTIVEVIYR